MTDAPRLRMWHDYICPFSYVAAARIMRIKRAEALNLDIRFHPWPLETANGTQPSAQEEDEWVRLLRAVEPELFAGWDPSAGCWPSSSRLLFAAYEAAHAQDSEAAARFDLLIRRAIFQCPRPLDSVEALSELAVAAGLDLTAFRSMLEDADSARRSPDGGVDGQHLAIRGIPTIMLPDGSTVMNPGIKLEQTAEGSTTEDDISALHRLLRLAAG